MAVWSTPWKYAVVGVGVLILLVIIICIICICRQKVPRCSGYDPLSRKDDVLQPVGGDGAAAKTTHIKPVGGGGAAAKTAHMQNCIWNAIVGPLQEGEEVYFHYTSKEVVPLIGQSGFKVSNLGMEGTGVYFSEDPPVYLPGLGRWPNTNPKFPQWPNSGFKEGLLRLNYGDAATDPGRQNLVDAVIIVKVPANIVKPVTDRPGAICIADKFYCHNNEPHMMKNQIENCGAFLACLIIAAAATAAAAASTTTATCKACWKLDRIPTTAWSGNTVPLRCFAAGQRNSLRQCIADGRSDICFVLDPR